MQAGRGLRNVVASWAWLCYLRGMGPRLRRRALACLLTGALFGCGPRGTRSEPEVETGRTVQLAGGLSFLLPPAYHEVTAASGRTFRLRGGAKQSYGTVHVQRRASGATLGLDETFSLLVAELSRQDGFDLSAMELHYAGGTLCLVYAAKFTLLDVARRQWGVLVDGAEGITAVMMTAPAEGFGEVSLDFAGVLASLYVDPRVGAPPPRRGAANAPGAAGSPSL